jgi:flagellin-like hook-associated protein FlgL
LNLTLASGADLTLGGNDTLLSALGFASNGRVSTTGTEAQVSTVDTIAAAINANSSLSGKVRASNDGGKLRIENLSTESLSVEGVDASGVTGLTGSSNTQSIGGNEVRKNLISQFNELRTQLDKLSDDASFNGINLLRGDKLSLNFNEGGTSKLDIQAKDANGTVRGISTADSSLDIDAVDADVMQSDTNIDARLSKLGDALTSLRTQSSSFGSNLSVVQNRQEFTKATINTLKTGADNLTLADMNEEAANLLSLQTRQQLSNTALSLANQADQGVLRLF